MEIGWSSYHLTSGCRIRFSFNLFGFIKIGIMEEIWKDIKDYEGYYQISNLGKIHSCDRFVKTKGNSERFVPGRSILPYIGHGGYYYVSLYKENKNKSYTLHRLIAETFIPNRENLPCVDHINTIRTDNSIKNLKWCSFKENNNNQKTIEHKRNASNHYGVLQISKEGDVIAEFESSRQIEEILGIKRKSIQTAISRKQKSHGFFWRYKD